MSASFVLWACMKTTLLSEDLDYILQHTESLWEALRGQRIFITGGTGFFGCWLLESFLWANAKLNLQAVAVVLTRNIAQFKNKCPHLFCSPSLVFQEGDVKTFEFPQGQFSYVIHAATDASVSLNQDNPILMHDTIVRGTKQALDFAKQCSAKGFLLTSSGAVYGAQPSHLSHIPEEYTYPPASPEIIQSAYAEGKRKAEEMCAHYAEQCHLNIKIARCFAFVGAHLPLDSHFAIGNFIRDGLKGQPIRVKSDGAPFRSYLYAADLAIWLWTILFSGENMRPYNVGSDESLTIQELAHMVAASFEPNTVVQIEQPRLERPPERYVPDISRARRELNLTPNIRLRQAIQLTKEWHTLNDSSP